MSEIEHYERMKKDFQKEIDRRKHNLECMLKGEYPQEYIDQAGLYESPLTGRKVPLLRKEMSSPISGENAMRHLKAIQDYEKIVEIIDEAFLNPLKKKD